MVDYVLPKKEGGTNMSLKYKLIIALMFILLLIILSTEPVY